MAALDGILKFLRLTHEAHHVERIARIPGEERYANMVEHSWQLAMLAWYVLETNKLPLDKSLVIRYALAHDLIEAYAGDTYAYDTGAQNEKQEREEAARARIAEEFPEFADLNEVIAAYEAREDEESKFVYALDKMVDPLNVYLEGGLLHQERRITFDKYHAYKDKKVRSHPFVYENLFLELNRRFKDDELTYFVRDDTI